MALSQAEPPPSYSAPLLGLGLNTATLSSYGAPPQDSYGAPPQSQPPTSSYGAPAQPAPEYGPPATTVHRHVINLT